MPAPQAILDLVKRFQDNLAAYKSPKYNEAQLRQEFLNPFFDALGWDMFNEQEYRRSLQGSDPRDLGRGGGRRQSAGLRLPRRRGRKFFVEAKKPSVNIEHAIHPAFQVRRYAWSAKLPLGILTDFEEFAVYDCRSKPNPRRPGRHRAGDAADVQGIHRKMGRDRRHLFRDAMLKGAFDQYAAGSQGQARHQGSG